MSSARILLVFSSLFWPAVAEAAGFANCITRLRNAAVESGVSRSVAVRALDLTEPDDTVLRLSRIRPEFTIPIWDYLAFLVDDERIADGRAMMRKYNTTLRAAERRFGVDRHVIAAVWGVESDYGRQAGDHFLPHALATLTCHGGRRTGFWRSELIAALKLVARGDLKLSELRGSWAGAFGHTQFIPSTYRRLAIDFDGDGRRDLVNSVADALGSTANYLKRSSWRRGESWMIEAKVRPAYRGPVGRLKKATLSTWARRGVTRADGAKLSGSARVGLLLPAGPRGPGFLTFRNFDAIYSYNHADAYAIAISHLADRLAGYPALRTPWPTNDLGLSRAQRVRLQELLIARGYQIGDADGKIGPATRKAITAAERYFGMAETDRAGQKIYRALGGK